jgi:hypothetical protein
VTRKSSRNLVERICGDEKDSGMYRKEGLNFSHCLGTQMIGWVA